MRAALLFLALSLPAAAQERVLSPERASGYDGILTQCVTFTRESFANDMCAPLETSVAGLASKAGLEHLGLGLVEWGFGTDEYATTPDTLGMIAPLNLTFYIRATAGPDSAAIWASLYREVPEGRLVIWEDSGIGAGERSVIRDGLSTGLARKLEPVFEALAKAN
ncbi:hypothetical protein [Vannielia litorea]|uniref:Uncharacterized protein n=1 Tax=Vannielia litorea TaxID=1217970 RepID=A0A1N6FRM3_9RHOB|nr:hypothetical protein [Vannielia litorea]SIN97893.1 hypothetical protein SAMN05444002_1898 [Vannielia litorea]